MEIDFADDFLALSVGESEQHLWSESFVVKWVLLYLQNFAIFRAIILSLDVFVRFSTFFSILSI